MIDIEAFKKAHPCGGLRVPEFNYKPLFKSGSDVKYPGVIENRDLDTKTKDQGSLPQCATYTAALFAEHLLWQRDGVVLNFDCDKIYKEAKRLDGDDGDGTTLDHALRAFLKCYPGYFVSEAYAYAIQKVAGWENEFKRYMHKYGCMMLGLAITDGWYYADVFSKAWIPSGTFVEGGHAVLCCGYNHKGVIIHNSWGQSWGENGYAVLSWKDFAEQFIYGCTLIRAFNNFE